MEEELEQVKIYHLQGAGIKISFSMEKPDEYELVYEDKQGPRRFTGRAIHRENIQLGFMPSVLLDGPIRILTLCVPLANKPKNAKSIKIYTYAVHTTIQTTPAGQDAIEGQIQNHEVLNLEGNAW